jgi:hypothetical protein
MRSTFGITPSDFFKRSHLIQVSPLTDTYD